MTALVLALVAAACSSDNGGGGLSDGEQAIADAIRDEILVNQDLDTPFGEAEAQCVGDGAVRELGTDGLLEIGISAENADPGDAFDTATPEQIDTIIDVTLDCVDFRQVLVEAITADSNISDESAGCLADALGGDEFLRPAVATGLTGDEAEFGNDPGLTETLLAAVTDCLSAEELIELGDSWESAEQCMSRISTTPHYSADS